MTAAKTGPAGLARFFHRIGRLKTTPRTGWLHRGVPPEQTESVADHTFRVSVMAWLAAADEPHLNRDRVMKLALIHDLAEAVTGDRTPYDPASLEGLAGDARRDVLNRRHRPDPDRQAAKRQAEGEAMRDLVSTLSPALQMELTTLFQELQEKSTPEARFVKEIDTLETFMQSREYLARNASWPMDSFALEAAETIRSPGLQALRDTIPASVEEVASGSR